MKTMLLRLIIGLARRGFVLVLIILANLAGGGCSESDNTPPQTVPQIIAQLKQQGYLKASNTGASDEFGFRVALDGDTLAVGALNEDSAATGVDGNQADNSVVDSGAVYVFTRTGGVWSQKAYVKASNTGASDQFGQHVALDGDTLAVGAINEASAATGINGSQADNSAQNSGAVYVFKAPDSGGAGDWDY